MEVSETVSQSPSGCASRGKEKTRTRGKRLLSAFTKTKTFKEALEHPLEVKGRKTLLSNGFRQVQQACSNSCSQAKVQNLFFCYLEKVL